MAGILVVEDERVVAKDIEETLIQLGYRVTGSAATGEECLNHARAVHPDLILMDVKIQGDLDGVETAKRVKSALDVPIIYLTAYADDDTVWRARETEAHGYVLKPFRASELKSAIEIALFKHKMEIELRQRKHWFSTTLHAIGEGVIAVDNDRVVSFANAKAQDLTGVGLDKLVGRRFDEVFRLINERTRRPLCDPVSHVLAERTPAQLPSGTLLLRAHDEFPIEDSIAPIVDSNDDLLGAVVVFRDAREQRMLHEQFAVADRLASLGTLSAGIAHEVNNPLTYIMGNTSFALDCLSELRASLTPALAGVEAPVSNAIAQLDDVSRQLREIEDGAERIHRIVMDLSVFARPEMAPGRGNMSDALRWAIRVTKTLVSSRAKLVARIDPTPTIAADETRIGQVLVNLLVNAAQAIPEGDAENQRIVVSTETQGTESVVVTVRDTGVGMSPEVVRRIFDPFFTTKPPGVGTGLGLSVCRSLVESMQGELTVESEPGEGSTFSLRLPVAETDSEPLMSPRQTPKLCHGRVLILDDDEVVAGAIARSLAENHDVVVETDPNHALKLLELGETFDAIIFDVDMRQASRDEFFSRACAKRPDLSDRFVFLTGGYTREASDFLARVSSPRLPKPPPMPELEDCVQALLAHRAAEAPVSDDAPHTAVQASDPPAPIAPSVSYAPQEAERAQKASARRILIVDDEIDLGRALCRVLSGAGFEPVHSPDASDALLRIEQESFDAVLTDISMPALDGIHLLRRVRAHDPDLPVVLITGHPDLETAVPAVEHGAFKYLSKPVAEAELIDTLQRAANLYRLANLKRATLGTLGTGLGEASDRTGLELTFQRALDSLWPAFQPILSVNDRTVFGYEALLRSDEPALPHPAAVLDAGERLGQLHRVGRKMRKRACALLEQLDDECTLFLNLHPLDLTDPSLLDPAAPHVAFAKRIVLEVTERTSLDRVADASARVKALRELGFRIAVDDLGAGYAGLASFVQLEPDLVKLDMCLVRNVDTSPRKQQIVRALVDVTHDLGLQVVGEGVETVGERDMLTELGCDLLQGYLFGKPAPTLAPAKW